MDYVNLGQSLKSARETLQLTQKYIADILHVTPQTVSTWETGKNKIDIDTLENLCNIYGINLIDVLSRFSKGESSTTVNSPIESTISPPEMTHIKKYRTLDEHGKEVVDTNLEMEYKRCTNKKDNIIPFTKDLDESNIIDLMQFRTPSAAGTGMPLSNFESFDMIQTVENYYTRQADFCLPIRGKSMEPRYHDGDIIMVQEQDDIEFGDIGIFVVDGMSYIKQKGENRLISLNKSVPDVYLDEYSDYHCMGKVIGVLDPDWIVK